MADNPYPSFYDYLKQIGAGYANLYNPDYGSTRTSPPPTTSLSQPWYSYNMDDLWNTVSSVGSLYAYPTISQMGLIYDASQPLRDEYIANKNDAQWLQGLTPDQTYQYYKALEAIDPSSISRDSTTGTLANNKTMGGGFVTPNVVAKPIGYSNGLPIFEDYSKTGGYIGQYYYMNPDGSLTSGQMSEGGGGWFGGLMDTLGGIGLSALTGGISDTIAGVQKYQDEGWGAGLDRAIDPGGSVDYTLRDVVGPALPDDVRAVAPAIGTAIGSALGSYIPIIGTAAGAAMGSGVGTKLAGTDYDDAFRQAAVSYGTAYLAEQAAQGLMDVGNTGYANSPSYAQPGDYFTVNPELELGFTPTFNGAGGSIFGGITEAAPGVFSNGYQFSVNPNLDPYYTGENIPFSQPQYTPPSNNINTSDTADITERLTKTGIKILSKALAGSAAPPTATSALMSSYSQPIVGKSYSYTPTDWGVQSAQQQQATVQQAAAQKAIEDQKKRQEIEDERQAYLKNWKPDFERTKYLSSYLA